MMRVRKTDGIIIILFILAATIFYGINRYNDNNLYNEKYAMIYSDNKLYKKIDLSNNDFTEKFQIDNRYGKNTVEIINGDIRMIDSNCQDKICVKSGLINKPGQSIICLPHKLVIEVVGNKIGDKNTKIDGVSY